MSRVAELPIDPSETFSFYENQASPKREKSTSEVARAALGRLASGVWNVLKYTTLPIGAGVAVFFAVSNPAGWMIAAAAVGTFITQIGLGKVISAIQARPVVATDADTSNTSAQPKTDTDRSLMDEFAEWGIRDFEGEIDEEEVLEDLNEFASEHETT